MVAEQVYSLGPFRLFRVERVLVRDGVPVRLTASAAALLAMLAESAGSDQQAKVLTRRLLADRYESADLDALSAEVNEVLKTGTSRHYIARTSRRRYRLIGDVGRGYQISESAMALPGRLPDPPAELLGREAELDRGIELLRANRMVTVLGTGGVGKTILAAAIARAVSVDLFEDVRFVDLAPLSRAASVASAVLFSLGWEAQSRSTTDDDIEALLRHVVGDRRILFVLDNCEHVVAAASKVAEQLLNSSGARVLATSREPLRVREERTLPLGPMAIPPLDGSLTVDEALRYGAVSLFLGRAGSQGWVRDLGLPDLLLIVQICARLDGLPLAIELVAPHARTLGLQALLEHSTTWPASSLVKDESLVARHQTLQATLDWSHALLGAQEQAVLHRLAVFRGDFSLESALRVLAGDIDGNEAMAAMMALQAKSLLVVRVLEGEVHYRLLETTRDYALAHLLRQPGVREVRTRQAMDCKLRLEAAEQEWTRMKQVHWMARQSRLFADLRAILDWSFGEEGDRSLGAELVVASIPLAARMTLLDEYLGLVERAIETISTGGLSHPKHELQLQIVLRTLSVGADEHPHATSDDHIYRLVGTLQDERSKRAAWVSLWLGASNRADYARAVDVASHQLAWAHESGDPVDIADAQRQLAMSLHFAGDQRQASVYINAVLRGIPHASRASYYNAAQASAGVSMRLLQARQQWLNGDSERAWSTALDALRLAECDHPYSEALVLTYAVCPIAMWNGEALAAQMIGRQRDCAARLRPETHKGWAQWFEYLLRCEGSQGGDRAPEGLPAPSEMQVDFLITMGCRWLAVKAIDRVDAGLVGWCAPEVRRVQGDLAKVSGRLGEARTFYLQAVSLARAHGALAWERRAMGSLHDLDREPPAA